MQHQASKRGIQHCFDVVVVWNLTPGGVGSSRPPKAICLVLVLQLLKMCGVGSYFLASTIEHALWYSFLIRKVRLSGTSYGLVMCNLSYFIKVDDDLVTLQEEKARPRREACLLLNS